MIIMKTCSWLRWFVLSQTLPDPYEDFMYHHLQYYGYYKGSISFWSSTTFPGSLKYIVGSAERVVLG